MGINMQTHVQIMQYVTHFQKKKTTTKTAIALYIIEHFHKMSIEILTTPRHISKNVKFSIQ